MSKTTPKNDRPPPKKSYQKPTLRRHGRIARVTAGGSGAMQEMGAMGMSDLTRFS